MTADDRVLFEVDADRRIATITLNNPAQRNSYDAAMRETLAAALAVGIDAVSVKGKTNEQVDSMGRGESMACHAVALLLAASR